MHVLRTFQEVVHDVLHVDIFKDVFSDYHKSVGINKIKIEVNVAFILSSSYILTSDDVFVSIQLLQGTTENILF